MEDIQKQIKDLEPWYQQINLGGYLTTTSKQSSIETWNKLTNILNKEKLMNSNILDLGCNAGLYSIMSVLSGAKSVVGIELNQNYFNQALFVKKYYEDLSQKPFPITYINKNISDVDFSSFEKFDFIFALAILYHIGKHVYGKYTPKALEEQDIIVKKLCSIGNCIIVRSRIGKYSSKEWYDPMFKKYGFVSSKVVDEGKRSLLRYDKI